ncbi:MAG: AAA family ATPase [Candidatus Methylomirabilales bacterium]
MYERFYGLQKSPFHITPDPEFLFLSGSHKHALGALVYCVERRKGFVAVTGAVGVGKTTVLRSALSRLDPERVEVVYVLNPNVTFHELVRVICGELGVPATDGDLAGNVTALHHALIKRHEQGKNVVLVIDEAQNTPVATLEDLRILSNLESATEKFIQLILVGQPELQRTLNLYELRQLNQRMVLRPVIRPLTMRESRRYIEYRLRKAGGTLDQVFTRGAVRCLSRTARGFPRTLNILCDNALVNGYASDTKPVTRAMAREAIRDAEGRGEDRRLPAWSWVAAGAAAILAAAGLYAWQPLSAPLGVHWTPETSARADAPARSAEPASTAVPGTAAPDGGTSSRAASAAGGMQTESLLTTRMVRAGDSLDRLSREVYGFSDQSLLRRIQRMNPAIRDVNKIAAGTTILFPRAEGR